VTLDKIFSLLPFINSILRTVIQNHVECAKCDFPHADYAFNLCTVHTSCMVLCGIAAVTWSGALTNRRHSAYCIPHFTFRITHAAIP